MEPPRRVHSRVGDVEGGDEGRPARGTQAVYVGCTLRKDGSSGGGAFDEARIAKPIKRQIRESKNITRGILEKEKEKKATTTSTIQTYTPSQETVQRAQQKQRRRKASRGDSRRSGVQVGHDRADAGVSGVGGRSVATTKRAAQQLRRPRREEVGFTLQ